MRVLLLALAGCLTASASPARAQCFPGAAGAARVVNVGDMAPDFSLQGSDGRTHRLADYRGKQAVVLVWFAKAFTGG